MNTYIHLGLVKYRQREDTSINLCNQRLTTPIYNYFRDVTKAILVETAGLE